MRRREVARPPACDHCGEEGCEAIDAEQCRAFAHLADQRARFSSRRQEAP